MLDTRFWILDGRQETEDRGQKTEVGSKKKENWTQIRADKKDQKIKR